MNSPALIGRPWPGSGSTPLPSTAGWSASVASASYSTPAVVHLTSTGTPTVFVGGLGMFAAYPASGGAPLWTFPVSKMVNASPTVLNGVVYFASTDGTMYAVDAKTGALRCSYDTNQFTEGSPLVVEAPDGWTTAPHAAWAVTMRQTASQRLSCFSSTMMSRPASWLDRPSME